MTDTTKTFQHIPSGSTELVSVGYSASKLAECASVAYWIENEVGVDRSWLHRQGMQDALHELAALLGYTLTPRATDDEGIARVTAQIGKTDRQLRDEICGEDAA